MIDVLEIKNFKCFEELRLEFGNLTLLTGYNGGGKLSAIQPLLLLAQSLRNKTRNLQFGLNGSLVKLGTIGDILPAAASNTSIEFKISGDKWDSYWRFAASAGQRHLHQDKLAGVGNDHLSNIALENVHYISAIREGTADHYPFPDGDDLVGDVGPDGRFSAYWYSERADEDVDEARRKPDVNVTTTRKQIDAWLNQLFPGAQANVQAIPQASLFSLQFRLSEIGAWRRPANIGYGLTYSFPIIVALLTAKKGSIIIIDSPEAHLHPSAQSMMGRILARVAAAGVQLIIETHSDHLLNGVRLGVKEGLLSPESVEFHFFTGRTSDGHGVISPTMDGNGRLDQWPTGFFDQAESDLSHLAGWG